MSYEKDPNTNKKPLIDRFQALGGIIREIINDRTVSRRPYVEDYSYERRQWLECQDPSILVKDFFYEPYLKERSKGFIKLQGLGLDIKSNPVNASYVCLMAATEAANNMHEIPKAISYMFEFRLPEQYLFSAHTKSSNQMGDIVNLLPETKTISAEIVQAWLIADHYNDEFNQLLEDWPSPHRSLQHTGCSFGFTCTETDLTFEDIGITSHLAKNDLIANGKNFLKLHSDTREPDTMQQVISSFMANIDNWAN